jgi:hypothetical protein
MIRFACFDTASIRIIDGDPVAGLVAYDPRHPDETTPTVLHVERNRAELIEGGQRMEFRRETSRIPGLMSTRGTPKRRMLVPLVCDDSYDSDKISSYLVIEKPEQNGPYGVALAVREDGFAVGLLTEVRRKSDPNGGRDEVYLATYSIDLDTGKTGRAYYSERYDFEYIVDATGIGPQSSFDPRYKRLGSGDFIAYPILEPHHTPSHAPPTTQMLHAALTPDLRRP